MALNPQQFGSASFRGTADQAAIDAGLRAYMLKVYNLMAMGVGLTGLVTLVMANSPELTIALAVGPMKWVLFFALIGMGFFSSKIITMRSSTMAHGFYWAYCVLWGIMIAPMILAFLQSPGGVYDIARAFFITAGTFAGVSIYGYVTKRNLGPIAAFASMAIIGLLIAGLVNIIFFEPSSQFGMLFSIGAVLLFAAMTAYETQMIKSMYLQNSGNGQMIERFAVFGALQLYGSFVVLFIHILNLIGIMRSE